MRESTFKRKVMRIWGSGWPNLAVIKSHWMSVFWFFVPPQHHTTTYSLTPEHHSLPSTPYTSNGRTHTPTANPDAPLADSFLRFITF